MSTLRPVAWRLLVGVRMEPSVVARGEDGYVTRLGCGLGWLRGSVLSGTLLAARRPRNPIGWVLLTILLLSNSPVWQYSVLDYRKRRIISRVISYTIITVVLAGVFAGLVILATGVLPFKTPVAVAASTLASAALFNPLRRRVQRAVDQRFNRARYDADQIVAAFAARLKDVVDLDSVRADLACVVQQALEPVHVSVWIKPGD
jgi:hypothetical protein